MNAAIEIVGSLTELLSAFTVFLLLCTGAALGCYIRPRLPDTHRAHDTIEIMKIMVGMLVTFAALVLGLLTASAKGTFDNASHDRQEYALQLTQFGRCLQDYGAGGDTARLMLASYTAAVIASTWPSEPHPTGIAYPDPAGLPRTGASPFLADLMNGVDLELRRLTAADPVHANILDECRLDYRDVLRARRAVIEVIRASVSTPFYRILVIWMGIIFTTFGLLAPRNTLSLLAIALCAFSLSSALFVISDLSHPYGGVFTIKSTDMRIALTEILAPSR